MVLPPLLLWFRLRHEHLERIPSTGPAIVVCNHISYLDPLTNGEAIDRRGRRPRFLAKEELFRIPLVGRVLRGAKQIPVARGTRDTSSLDAAADALARGEVVLVYPEGTVTTREDGLPMSGKTGAVRLALLTGVPIIPMASWGSLASEGAANLDVRPWLILFPGLALTVTLFSLNFLGDGLRDALDPQVSR